MGTVAIGVFFADLKGFSTARYVPQGRNLGRIRIVHGGVCRNVAENMAHVGHPVQFVSLCDDSPLGRELLSHLTAEGVDTRHVARVEEDGIGMWLVILDEKGELAGSVSQMPDVAALERLLDAEGEELIRQADNVVLELDLSAAITEKVLALAEKYGKKVYAIVANMRVIRACPAYLRRLDCFVCNEVEAGQLFGTEAVRLSPAAVEEQLPVGMARLGIPAMVVTLGREGAVYCDRRTGERGYCPAVPAAVVDSSGAGDAFLSGVVVALSRGLPLGRAVEAGTRLAAAAIGTEGSTAPRTVNFLD